MARWLHDAGHGGTDPGATYGGRTESADVLRLVKRVAEILRYNGETVELTRTSEKFMSLEARTNMENKGKYDYFVSYHRNDATDKTTGKRVGDGVETYSLATTGQGRKLSENLQGELKPLFNKDRGCKTAGFWVLRKTNCPAVLMEIGFIHNSADNKVWDTKFEELARAIARGCLKQVGKTLKLPTSSTPPSSSTTTQFRVVCGWYSSRDNAVAQQNKLKSAGFDSFLVAYTSNGVAGFRVVAGTYSNRDNAVAQQAKLKSKGFDSFLVAI